MNPQPIQSLDDDNNDQVQQIQDFEIYQEDIKEINLRQKPLKTEDASEEGKGKISAFGEDCDSTIQNQDKENDKISSENNNNIGYILKVANKIDQLENLSKKIKINNSKNDSTDRLNNEDQRIPLQELVEEKKDIVKDVEIENKQVQQKQKQKLKQNDISDFGEFMSQCKKKIPKIQRDKIKYQQEQEKLKEEKLKKESLSKENIIVVQQDGMYF